MYRIKIGLIIALFCCTCFAENNDIKNHVLLTYKGNGGYSLIERTNLRRYENDKYIGLTSREIRSFISPIETKKNDKNICLYDGNFYVYEETLRNKKMSYKGIHDSIRSCFSISSDGNLIMYKDNGYPTFRSFPAFPNEQIKIGDTWSAMAERTVDPLNKGKFTKIPMLVSYTFIGEEFYKGNEVYRIKANWQTNYNLENMDFRGDSSLLKASGGHKADIIVLKATGEAILIVDNVNETFFYVDGLKLNFKGTINLFTEFPPSVNTKELIAKLEKVVPVEKTVAGLRLSMRDIKFKPDSDEILDDEKVRLDEISKVLLTVENQLLVEGHTAMIGNPSGEQKLSELRAKKIAQELVNRGINADRLICRGFGGTKPLASNETAEGRALNRRVEITVLE